MKTCAEIRPLLALYVDQEVRGAEALGFEAHLTVCDECRRAYESLRGTVDAVRASAPLYEVPDQPRESIRRMVTDWERRENRRRWTPVFAVAAVILLLAAISVRNARPDYQRFAARAHRSFARGAFPLDVTSGQPQEVSSWLEPRVPFHVQIPNYPEGRPKRYSLLGARLMQYRGEDVAYLAYEMDRKPISLLISASSRVLPSGEESYQSGGLDFFFSSEQGLRIITWRDKGLTYAQVSELDGKSAESCAICHAAEGERRRFENLRRRN